MDYRVELDVFNGPLDLLLFLIKRDELDVYDIPISRITDTYMQYLHGLREMSREHGLDINVAGDFLVMAATLMEIKSAMLLPRAEVSSGGEKSAAEELTDPRLGLVRQLLEYKRLKDQATLLEKQKHEHESRFPRVPVLADVDPSEPPPLDMDEVQIWDLLDAFSRLMSEVGVRKPRYHEVAYDDTPIELHAADIEDRLRREHHLSLRALLIGRATRSEMIGIFLALLELVRQKKVLIRQNEQDATELEIENAPPEHRRLHIAGDAVESTESADSQTESTHAVEAEPEESASASAE